MDTFIHSFIHSSSSSSCANSTPCCGGVVSGSFLPVERTMPVIIKREDVQALSWAQVNALCKHVGIAYYAKGSKSKDNATKKEELWQKLSKEGDDARSVAEHVWAAVKQLKSKDTIARFDELVAAESLKRRQSYGRSQKNLSEANDDSTMEEVQTTPDKRQEIRKKKTKPNTPAFNLGAAAGSQKSAVDQEGLSLRHAISASLQFSATATETDWAMVVNQMGPALQLEMATEFLNAVHVRLWFF